MEKGQVHGQMALPAHHQPSEVGQPGEGPLDFPTPPIAAQLASVLRARLLAIAPVRGDQLNAPPRQSAPERIAVISLIHNQALWLLARPTRSSARHGNRG